MDIKITKTTRFPKDMNKGRRNFKFQIMKHEHDMCKTRFQQNFIARTRKNKKGCDKRMHPKLILNRLKVIRNFTSIYTHWALNSRKFLKKLPTYIWPMFTYVHL
jgi:hypothetical protein